MRFLLLFLPLWAAAAPVKTPHVTAELVSENSELRSGEANFVGLRLQMIPEWHTYWRYPGDSGLPTEIVWHLPAGWAAGPLQWRVPERIEVPPLVNYGYSGETIIGASLALPAGVAPGHYEVGAIVSWLVCKEECVPEKVELKWPVTVGKGAAKPGPFAAEFARLRAEQPRPGNGVKVVYKDKLLGLEMPGPMEGQADFFPLAPMVVKGNAPPRAEGRTLWLEKADPFDAQAKALPGVLVFREGAQTLVFEIAAPLATSSASPAAPVAPPPASAAAPAPASSWLMILLAFVGGLVLNLMPCVFPVLGIKVMGLVKQGGMDRGHGRRHGIAYALGILICFWALAGALMGLRSAGQAVGWGFQLQHPVFVTLLVLLFSFVAADLAGFVKWTGTWMGAGSRLADREGYSGSLFTGILAVLVATPCTAPFMGTAIGATIGEAGWVVFLVFTALALGLALPFVVLCFHPAYLRFLPKPGAWMDTLKKVLALPIAATVLWLLWVLAQQIEPIGAFRVVLGLAALLVAIVARHRSETGPWRWFGNGLFALGVLGAVGAAAGSHAVGGVALEGAWQPYSQAMLEDSLASGKPVFVDFTAAWCLTCQVNKRLVLDRASMQEFFREKRAILLMADWTNRDAEITRALEAQGRLGVPLYLLYRAGTKTPAVLPQILTESAVREAF